MIHLELVSSFQERLKEAMGDMTATELSAYLDISKQSVSAYLTGKRKPKRFVAEAIAKILYVDPAWLFGYDVPMRPLAHDTPCVSLSPDELALIDNYRLLNNAGKEYIQQTISIATQAYSEKNNAVSDLETAN
jgi:transcriptional regulator with XRE-family HTH domain